MRLLTLNVHFKVMFYVLYPCLALMGRTGPVPPDPRMPLSSKCSLNTE